MRFKTAALVAVAVITWLFLKDAAGQPHPNCVEFGFQISTNCCCSAGCCRETAPGDVVHVQGNTYRIVASGQEIERTGWSPDGRTIRCACDSINGQWTVHPTAFTRCLYMPMPSS